MFKFKYIIGANIELDVEAKHTPGINATSTDPKVDAEMEIVSVTCCGLDVETNDIYIMTRCANVVGRDYRPKPLDVLIYEAAWETDDCLRD